MSTPPTPAPLSRAVVRVATALAAVALLAGCGGGSAASGRAATTTSLDPAAAAVQDAAFAAAMIDHHHRTLQLVGLAAAHAENPAILDYAGELQSSHDSQLRELTAMMEGWGKTPPTIEGHTDLGDSIPGVLDEAQLTALVASAPAAFEKTFLATLIDQQRKALPIARKELDLGADPQAKATAQRILDDVATQLDTLTALSQS